MPKRKKQLQTFDDVVRELGGSTAVARMCKLSLAAVSAWRKYDAMFPPKYYPGMQRVLAKRGCEAPQELWRFAEINHPDAA
jgi:hypothetical protein